MEDREVRFCQKYIIERRYIHIIISRTKTTMFDLSRVHQGCLLKIFHPAGLFALLKRLNETMGSAPFSRCDAQLALDFLYRADRVLSVLGFDQPMLLDEHVRLLVSDRSRAIV